MGRSKRARETSPPRVPNRLPLRLPAPMASRTRHTTTRLSAPLESRSWQTMFTSPFQTEDNVNACTQRPTN
ncbi:hypothetical protein FKM82_021838 [Ascaphus truei]